MASIKKLPNGTYQATIYLGRDANGKQIRKYVTRETLKDCKAAAREIEQEYSEGLLIETDNIRFSKWADEWLSLHEKQISPSTYLSYKMYIEKHFKPFFGNIKVSQINEILIKKYISDKLKFLSTTTVRKHIYILSAILQDILKHKNPCKDIDIPEVAQYNYHIITDSEFKLIRDYYRGKNYELIILLGGLCGMRRGEIFALKWNDIDKTNQTIKIDQSLCISTEGYIEKNTKSKNGIRTIVAPKEIFDLFEKKRKNQKILSDRIFNFRPDTFSKQFAKDMKKIGLENVRFHDLRHYHATWLYKNGIPDLFAAQRLGDDLQTIKRIYQHISDDLKDRLNKEILDKISFL